MGSSGRGRCELVAGKLRGRRGLLARGNHRLRVTESCAWKGLADARRGIACDAGPPTRVGRTATRAEEDAGCDAAALGGRGGEPYGVQRETVRRR
eukprot:4513242-Amphidinium_carterae.5